MICSRGPPVMSRPNMSHASTDVAELRVAAGLLPGVIIESGAAVHEHDTRQAPAWLGGVDKELTGELGIAVRVRLGLGVNHRPDSN